MFNITAKHFSIFNNNPRWVEHITRDFLTCYSCSYYSISGDSICYPEFLIKWSILDIRQGSESVLISECTRVVNTLGFWICQGYRCLILQWICQGSKDATYTWFWIKFPMIDIWQSSEYVWNYEYGSAKQFL